MDFEWADPKAKANERLVSYTDRGDKIRIISARMASGPERRSNTFQELALR